MKAYYNENNPHAAAMLRELIADGIIASGYVDERSITEVQPGDVEGYTHCHFFAGIGGWSIALRLAGWDDSRPVWTGSPPCQPFSSAGQQKGYEDDRHLLPAWLDLIGKCHPASVFGEQVASAIAHGWLDDACMELEAQGYATAAAVLPACSVGAPHKRNRLWLVADSQRGKEWQEPRCRQVGRMGRQQQSIPWHEPWESALARLRAVDDGFPREVAITDAARNGIVPQVAAQVIRAAMCVCNATPNQTAE